uniref:Uncharacterized protein n=1 Tax=Branchiostoma floridae TaxID=7739 RepID=C3ZJP5_BRAFL|eukprot:XP_002591169.1 hypothetical protein BRAFLDRAFT_105371 [Branchiostoma floridae]
MPRRRVDQVILSSVPGAGKSTTLTLIRQRLSTKYNNVYPGGIYVNGVKTDETEDEKKVEKPRTKRLFLNRASKFLVCSTTFGMELQQEEIGFLFDKLDDPDDTPVLSVRERCSGDAFGIFSFVNYHNLRTSSKIWWDYSDNWEDFVQMARRGARLARTVLSQYSQTLVIYLRGSAKLCSKRLKPLCGYCLMDEEYMKHLVNLYDIYYRCEGFEQLVHDEYPDYYDPITTVDVFNSATATISIVDITKFDGAPERLADHIIDQIEEEQAKDQIEAAVHDMLSTWEDKFRYAIHMATLPIDNLLPVCSKVKMEAFLAQLDVVLAELGDDYRLFVCRYAPPPQDTLVGINLRFYVKRVLLVLERLKKLISCMITKRLKPDFGTESPNDIMTFNAADRISYMEANHVPSHKLYHHKTGIQVAADIPHAITSRSLYEHVCRFWGERQIPTNSDQDVCQLSTTYANQPDAECFDTEAITAPLSESTTIIYSNKFANDIIDYVCHLSSYPVVPPDLKGTLRSTLDDDSAIDAQNVPLGTPGPDSRRYVTDIASPRACIWCKIGNIGIGHTDVIEQAKRARCQCIFSNTCTGTEYKAACKVNPGYFEGAPSTRATTMNKEDFGEMRRSQQSAGHEQIREEPETEHLNETGTESEAAAIAPPAPIGAHTSTPAGELVSEDSSKNTIPIIDIAEVPNFVDKFIAEEDSSYIMNMYLLRTNLPTDSREMASYARIVQEIALRLWTMNEQNLAIINSYETRNQALRQQLSDVHSNFGFPKFPTAAPDTQPEVQTGWSNGQPPQVGGQWQQRHCMDSAPTGTGQTIQQFQAGLRQLQQKGAANPCGENPVGLFANPSTGQTSQQFQTGLQQPQQQQQQEESNFRGGGRWEPWEPALNNTAPSAATPTEHVSLVNFNARGRSLKVDPCADGFQLLQIIERISISMDIGPVPRNIRAETRCQKNANPDSEATPSKPAEQTTAPPTQTLVGQSRNKKSNAIRYAPGSYPRHASLHEQGEIEIHQRDSDMYCSAITGIFPVDIDVVGYRNAEQKKVIVEYIYQYLATEMAKHHTCIYGTGERSIYPFNLKATIDIDRPSGDHQVVSLMMHSNNDIMITSDAAFRSRLHYIIGAINDYGPPMTQDGVNAHIFLEALEDKVREGVIVF